MKGIRFGAASLALSALLIGAPASANPEGVAAGTGATSAGITLTIAASDASPVRGYALYAGGSGFVSAVALDCVAFGTSNDTFAWASGVDHTGIRRYLTIQDTGPGGVADFFTFTGVSSSGPCDAAEDASTAIMGGGFVVTYA